MNFKKQFLIFFSVILLILPLSVIADTADTKTDTKADTKADTKTDTTSTVEYQFVNVQSTNPSYTDEDCQKLMGSGIKFHMIDHKVVDISSDNLKFKVLRRVELRKNGILVFSYVDQLTGTLKEKPVTFVAYFYGTGFGEKGDRNGVFTSTFCKGEFKSKT